MLAACRSASPFLPILFLCFFLPSFAASQTTDIPREVRGYKVHRAKVVVFESSSTDADARIKFGEPRLADVSVSGITFELSAETDPLTAAGTIDLLTFQDFHVNGIVVDIDDIKGPIQFAKGVSFRLPHPAVIEVGSAGVVQAAWNEFRNSKDDWLVTGRVFVLGTFKKMGFTFKRAIPIDIRLTIKNPLPRLE